LEDFIVHHSKTLKKLELHDCSICVEKGSERPLYWADIYKRLAKALTGLVELEVEFEIKRDNKPYVCLGYTGSYHPVEILEGTEVAERDALALEEFKAIVKN
jgi:hypothetical protein